MDIHDEDTKSSSSLKLKRLNKEGWVPFAKLLTALFGIKGCRIPILKGGTTRCRCGYISRICRCTTDVPAALATWDKDNQKCFDLTMLAMSQCPEGQTVLASFEFNPTIVDLANPAKYADDGRGAYLQLASNAMGGQGITTGTYFMRQLFDIKQKDASVKDRVTRHNEACHRLLQCQDVTLEKLLTAHLLYVLGPDPAYVVVNHECSKDGTTYSDAYNMIMACHSRLELTSEPTSLTTDTAFAARVKRPPLTPEQLKEVVCHECGQKGHFRTKCPKLNRAKGQKAKGKSKSQSKKQVSSSEDDTLVGGK